MPEMRKFPHHLIREIFEQPDALRRAIAPRVSLAEGRVNLDEIHISHEELRAVRRINIVASGTSRHAGMTGQFMMQELAGVPVDVDYASEFEYRDPVIGRGELSIFITQSGETADTTASQREARQKGSRTIAISNVEGSTIAREADGFIYTHAGPEISIASTKAFTAQMACLFLFALYLGEIKEKVSKELAQRCIGELLALPQKMEAVLAASDQVEKLAELYYRVSRTRHPLPDRDGWSPQAQRSFLRSCRRLSHRRSQARAKRADRFPLAPGHDRHLRPDRYRLRVALRPERQQHGRL
jgi:glucosamine--fructose-6-phosphate aminotransferase (isomerizing)